MEEIQRNENEMEEESGDAIDRAYDQERDRRMLVEGEDKPRDERR